MRNPGVRHSRLSLYSHQGFMPFGTVFCHPLSSSSLPLSHRVVTELPGRTSASQTGRGRKRPVTRLVSGKRNLPGDAQLASVG